MMPRIGNVKGCLTFGELDALFVGEDEDTTKGDELIAALDEWPELFGRLVDTLSDHEALIELVNRSPYYQIRDKIISLWLEDTDRLCGCLNSLEALKRVHELSREYYLRIVPVILQRPENLLAVAPTLGQFIQFSQYHALSQPAFDQCLLRDDMFEHYIASARDYVAAVSYNGVPHLQTELLGKLMRNPQHIVKTAADKTLLLRAVPDEHHAAINAIAVSGELISATPASQQHATAPARDFAARTTQQLQRAQAKGPSKPKQNQRSHKHRTPLSTHGAASRRHDPRLPLSVRDGFHCGSFRPNVPLDTNFDSDSRCTGAANKKFADRRDTARARVQLVKT